MIGYFPLFAVALIWVRGLGQLSLGFLGRMLLFRGVGFDLVLLILVWIILPTPRPRGSWTTLCCNWVIKKTC